MANINKIKYYPDRFYIGLDGFDLTKLFEVSPDYTLSLQQAIFIHEYFHYLTNISTFQGVRSFQMPEDARGTGQWHQLIKQL